ncbi:MAG: 2,3-bisphosphoglycerate-dependent phosphoglycerate mutase [Arenicella sp.]|jgi:2,3-bisphosphoglycerate-dependent phosphoglycerate mutase
MMKTKTLIFFFALILMAQISVLQAQDREVTTFFFVRHAEKKLDESKNPNLTDEGAERAEHLQYVLHNVDFSAIYTTNFNRTTQTIQPVAHAKGMQPNYYSPMDGKATLDEIMGNHEGKNILIVGHSNTIPMMMNMLLGEEEYDQFPDDAYGDLYIVNILKSGKAVITQLSF